MLLTSGLAFPPATGGKGGECISPSPNSMVWQVRVGWGQISHVHLLSQLTCVTIYTVSSPVLPRQGTGSTSPSSAAGKGEGSTFPPAAGIEGQGKEGIFPWPYHHAADERGVASDPTLTPSGPAHSRPANRIRSTVLPTQGAGHALPNSAGEARGQFFHSHDPEASCPICCRWQGAMDRERWARGGIISLPAHGSRCFLI